MKRFIKPFSLFFLGFSLLVATSFLILYIATPILGEYKATIERIATETLHQPVKIGSSKGIWLESGPVLALKDVTIFEKNRTQPILKIAELRLGPNILSSLWHRNFVIGYLYVNGTYLKIQQDKNNQIRTIGLTEINQQNTASPWNELLEWTLSRQKIQLDNIAIDWQKPNGQWVHIPYFAFDIKNSWNNHQTHLKLSKTDVGTLLKEYRFKGWQIETGQVDALNLHGTWHYDNLRFLKGSINASHVNIIEPDHTTWRLNSFITHLLWRGQIHDQWFLKLTQLYMNLDDGQIWSEKNLQVNAFPVKKGGALYTIRTSDINLTNLWQLLNKLNWLSPEARNLIHQIKPQGNLKNTYLEYPYFSDAKPTSFAKTPTDLANMNWKFSTEIHNLIISPWQKIPGVQQLTGYLEMTNGMGQFRLDSEKLRLTFPAYFRSPLFFEHAQANIDWQNSPNGYKINATGVQADNSDAKLKGDVSLWLPTNNQNPFINLCGEFKVNPNAKVSPYLPINLMQPKLIKWLDHAFPQIGNGKGTIVLRGPLNNFPFPKKEGIFAVHTDINDVSLNYFEQWPIATHIFGKLNFDGPKMSVFIKSATILNNQVKSAYGEIPILVKGIDAELHTKINVISDLRDAARFIQQSPLNKKLGSAFEKLKLEGDAEINVGLNIPLENEKAPLKAWGNIDMSEAKITLPLKKLAFENVMGILHFTQDNIQANNIRAEFLNTPILINIENDQGNQTLIQFKGNARISDLQKTLQINNLSSYINGDFAYQTKLILPPNTSKNPNQLVINTNLKGIRVNLPEPLNKPNRNDILPSAIAITFGEDKPFDINFNYGQKMKGALRYLTKNFDFERGNIVLGEGNAKLPSQPGLWITGALPKFNTEEWKAFFQSTKRSQSDNTTTDIWPKILQKISLQFKNIELFDQNFQNIELTLSRMTKNWLLGIESEMATGQITIPDDQNSRWDLNFKKLYLKAGTEITKKPLNAKDIPALHFSANDFRYGNKQFGKTNLTLTPTSKGLKIQQLSAESNAFSLTAEGDWQTQFNRNDTHLVGQIHIYDVGETLARFGTSASITGKEGRLYFILDWPDAPYNPSSKSLSGNFSITLDKGHIIHVGAEASRNIGLGELLNFFSLQNLSHLLALDFSNTHHNGFAFDIMRGNFKIKNGNIYTQDTYLEGPIARVSIQGLISLVNKNYDLYISVTPYITSSLPLVATLAAGPVVGATAWVADKLIGKQVVGNLMTRSYRMQGPWTQSTVTEVNKDKS